jgi:hypothetical protein
MLGDSFFHQLPHAFGISVDALYVIVLISFSCLHSSIFHIGSVFWWKYIMEKFFNWTSKFQTILPFYLCRAAKHRYFKLRRVRVQYFADTPDNRAIRVSQQYRVFRFKKKGKKCRYLGNTRITGVSTIPNFFFLNMPVWRWGRCRHGWDMGSPA